jgi:hypothetical protein
MPSGLTSFPLPISLLLQEAKKMTCRNKSKAKDLFIIKLFAVNSG